VTIREIRQVGDPILRTPSDPVRQFDKRLRALADDMFQTMYDAPGVGLAANQIGVALRLFVYDCGPAEGDEDGPEQIGIVCNPRIIMLGQVGFDGTELAGTGSNGARPSALTEPDWADGDEGCLSVRGLAFRTPRWSAATVSGVDVFGDPLTVRGTGLLARCLQHETDHLDGRLYLDRLLGEQKALARKALADSGRP